MYCKKVIIATFIIPLLGVWPVAVGHTSYLPFYGNTFIAYEHRIPWARTSYGRLAIALPTLFFTIYSSVLTSAKLRKLGKHMRKVEYSMNIATIFNTLGFILVVILNFCYVGISAQALTTKLGNTLAMGGTQLSNDFYMMG